MRGFSSHAAISSSLNLFLYALLHSVLTSYKYTVCQLRRVHFYPENYINRDKIPVLEGTKSLGLYFDRKVAFLSHIKYVKKKCLKALDILRVVAHLDSDADRELLLQLQQALVRSKVDTRPSYLKMLDRIQNQGLTLCFGAFRKSPADSLAVEAVLIRRNKLALQYICSVAACPDNPVHNIFLRNISL